MEKQLLKEPNSVQMIDACAAKLSDYSYPIIKSSNWTAVIGYPRDCATMTSQIGARRTKHERVFCYRYDYTYYHYFCKLKFVQSHDHKQFVDVAGYGLYQSKQNPRMESIFNKLSESIYFLGVSIDGLQTFFNGTQTPILLLCNTTQIITQKKFKTHFNLVK